MDKYIKKAEILTKHFNIYGYGNFDLSIEELAYVLKLLCEDKNKGRLEDSLEEFYERLEKQRLG